jgi:hypothetical protein
MLIGEDTLQIPDRAVGRGIRNIWIADVASPTVNDFRELKMIDISEIKRVSHGTGNTAFYYYEDDELKLFPVLTKDSTIRLYFLSRPGELVLENKTCTVTAVGTTTLSVDATPNNIALGSKIDVIKVTPGFKNLVEDQVLTARGATTLTVAGYDFSTKKISVGDIVSLSRQSSVVQIPEDCIDTLIWSSCNQIAVALGITDMIDYTQKSLVSALQNMQMALVPRSEEPQKIVNGRSLLRSGAGRFNFLSR